MFKYLTITVILFAAIFSASCAFASGQEVVKFYADANVSQDMTVDDVVVVGGNATISGRVNNGIVVVGGSVELKPGSYVAEHVVVVGGKCIKAPTAQIGGKISEIEIPHFIPSLECPEGRMDGPMGYDKFDGTTWFSGPGNTARCIHPRSCKHCSKRDTAFIYNDAIVGHALDGADCADSGSSGNQHNRHTTYPP